MFIYFVATDRTAAEREMEEMGWLRIAVRRWVSPDRNDLNLIFHTREFTNIPGGNYFLPSRTLRDAVGGEPYKFKEMCMKGQAQWVENPLMDTDETIELLESIKPPPTPLTDFVSTIEQPSPLHSIQDIREKARGAARATKESNTVHDS
jgi:hypothetical protein